MVKFHLDLQLFLPVLLLGLFGLLILRSVAPGLVIAQLSFFIVSFVVVIIFSLIDYKILFSFHKIIYYAALGFVILPYIFGTLTRGSFRWIPIGTFSLQPSEIIKPLLLITFSVLAVSVSRYRLLYLFGSIFPPALIIFRQPDLGTTLVLISGWSLILFSQIPVKLTLGMLLCLVVVSAPVYQFILHDYQKQRLLTFINPYQDPLGQGYHAIQSIIAVGSGGLWGRGLGQGTQSQLRFLPEHHTDFIFASVCEELGFAGAFTVIILFMLLIWRIYRISQAVDEPMAALFCLASAAMLAFQAFVNMGMDMGLVPITGITLPFISYGGSSLLSLGILLGIINSISANIREQQFYMIK